MVKREEKKFEVAVLIDFTKTVLALLRIKEEQERRGESEYSIGYVSNPCLGSGIPAEQFVKIALTDRKETTEFTYDKIGDFPDYLMVSRG